MEIGGFLIVVCGGSRLKSRLLPMIVDKIRNDELFRGRCKAIQVQTRELLSQKTELKFAVFNISLAVQLVVSGLAR